MMCGFWGCPVSQQAILGEQSFVKLILREVESYVMKGVMANDF
jgi:hypothetical protein